MSTMSVCSNASLPYATAKGSETIIRPSTMPVSVLRSCCLLMRIASAGTPTTARTFCDPSFPPFSRLPLTPTSPSRWVSSSRTAARSFSEPSRMRPRSSGRCSSSMGRFSSASWPMSTSRLRILRETMSTGQPTRLLTTCRCPFEAEMELWEVPRSMPT